MKLIRLANQFALFTIFFLLASAFLGFGGFALWQVFIKNTFTILTYVSISLFFLCSVLFWMATKDAIAARMGSGVKLAQRFTKKDEAYQEALSTQALYRHYFQAAPIGIIALDINHTIEICNPMFATMTERSANQCLKQPLYTLFHKNDQDKLKAAITVVEQQGDPTLIEVQLATKKETTVAVYIGMVDNPQTEDSRLVLHLLDISARKDLEKQFVQSQKMQAVGQLAGGIAHDFNNLLTAIMGFCDLLLQRHTAGDPSFADINHIQQNSTRAAGLVRQLLAFSRQQKLTPKVLNITDTLAELGHLLRRLLGESVGLDIQHSRDLWLVRVDQTQLEQVIINLAVNARDAMTDHGALTITTANITLEKPQRLGTEDMLAGEYVLIRVTDTGSGIPVDIIERIFDPFFSTKDVGAGTGLGLATVYGIMKQTGGYIGVDSVVGRGTSFSLYIPRYDGVEEKKATKEIGDLADLTGSGVILLVEDEDPVRLFGARALRNKGYEVIEARSGEAALEILNTEPRHIDLLITDMMMPVIDGPTLIRIIREKMPNLKVMCISGYAEENMRKRLEDQADIAFLAKPFSLKQLASMVKQVLEV
jgi:two-component system cell cycle sensor histidine kinase/response regulator CckA